MTVPPVDRAAAVRGAVRTLVARNGFHGASMSAVASQAGVATGTAYTHYASKDELVLAAYRDHVLPVPVLQFQRRCGAARRAPGAGPPSGGPALPRRRRASRRR
jgi:AcrR family transcriptional regulator